MDSDGDFVVAWQSYLLDSDAQGIAARLNPPAQRSRARLLSGFPGSDPEGVGVGQSFATNPDPSFQLSSLDPGATPAQNFSFSTTPGDLETYSVQWSYPDGFVFNGFHRASAFERCDRRV